MPQTLIIIPTYNEVGNLSPLVHLILGCHQQTDILFVDDGSRDGTRDEIEALGNTYPERVFSLFRSGRTGLGSAYRDGMCWALERDYEWILQMDGDGSHHPESLAVMYRHLADASMVVGSRYVACGDAGGLRGIRKVISGLGGRLVRNWLAIGVRDVTGGFNGWRRELLIQLDFDTFLANGYAFQIELKYRALRTGARYAEVPIHFGHRRSGASKFRLEHILEALPILWRLKWADQTF